MAPPLYFLPGVTREQFRPGGGKLAPDALSSRRLDLVLRDVPVGRMSIVDLHRTGPGDQHGILLRAEAAAGGMADRLDYLPDEQQWQGVVDPGDHSRHLYWIGIDKLSPPKPADLVRLNPLPGHIVTMADGQLWEAPMVRRPPTLDGGEPHATNLPCGVEFGFGASTLRIRQEYRAIWEKSARVFDVIWCGEAVLAEEASLLDLFALDCLALNYRIGPFEANALGIFDTDSVTEVVNAAIGVTFFKESKKN